MAGVFHDDGESTRRWSGLGGQLVGDANGGNWANWVWEKRFCLSDFRNSSSAINPPLAQENDVLLQWNAQRLEKFPRRQPAMLDHLSEHPFHFLRRRQLGENLGFHFRGQEALVESALERCHKFLVRKTIGGGSIILLGLLLRFRRRQMLGCVVV